MTIDLPFGGLSARETDERISMERALTASDCYIDDDAVRGRNGYTAASAAALAASGTPQGLWRFRHGPEAADGHCVAVVGGLILRVEDPSGDTVSDATVATLEDVSATWSAAQVSAAQLGNHLYIGSDVENAAWRRVNRGSPITITTMVALPQGAKPTQGSGSSLAWVGFNASKWGRSAVGGAQIETLTPYTGYSAYRIWGSGWIGATGNYPTSGMGVLCTLSTPEDWSGYQIIGLAVAPPPENKGGGTVNIEIGDSSGNYVSLGAVKDDSLAKSTPGVIWLRLSNISATLLASVKYLRFTISGRGLFVVSGYVLSAASPGTGTFRYRTSFYDSSTQQESVPTEELEVTLASPQATDFPLFPLVVQWSDDGTWYPGLTRMDPGSLDAQFNGNRASGLTTPTRNEFAGAPVINQAIPSSIQAGGSCRLWRQTSTGWRLVDTVTWTSATTTVQFVDDLSDRVLANERYRVYGTPPRCTAMAAMHGRVIAAYQNRVYISSYIGPDVSSDPYPVFPAIAVEESDGWSFDIAPSPAEQVQALVAGDALYICTSEAVYAMRDLSPNSAPSVVLRRGAIGRRACIYAEDRVYWAGWDGIYAASGRAAVVELTEEVRRYYQDTFSPTSAVVLAYQARRLYAFSGTRYMRFDFVTGRWTTGTVAHAMLHAAHWHDPGGTSDRLWFLASDRNAMRWLPAATTDNGTARPSWVYCTGYAVFDSPVRVRRVLADVGSGSVTVSLRKRESATPKRDVTIAAPADGLLYETPGPADLRGYAWKVHLTGSATTVLRRCRIAFEASDGRGG